MTHKTADELIAFELKIKRIFEAGELPFLLHLCGGDEDALVEIFKRANPGDWFFGTHRSHYLALLAGLSEEKVEVSIRTGDSMFIFEKSKNFYSSAILSGTPCIAAGVAWQLKQENSFAQVWCFIGDGAEDNGHFCEAVRFVDSQQLRCIFVIADNNRQVDTSYSERWGTSRRFEWPKCVIRYHYTPTFPHGGRGPGPMITFKSEIVAQFTKQA